MPQTQFGALPLRGTREGILLVTDILRRFRKRKGQKGVHRIAAILFDLEKAFDKIPRAPALR